MTTGYIKRIEFLLKNTGDMALKRRARKILSELDVLKGDKILDIGCGDGYYLYLISNLETLVDLTGTDVDTTALASARKNLHGKKVRLVSADLMRGLPFPQNSFDKIVMSEVAEHLSSDLRGLKEVYRVLKPGGTICLSVPNFNYPFLWDPVNWTPQHFFNAHIKRGFWAGIWNQHIRLYKPNKISGVVKRAGFKIKEVKSLTWWCLPFNHNLINLIARQLYGGKLPQEIVKSISKYSHGKKRKLLFDLAFGFVNLVDKLNDIWCPKDSGVSVVVIATK